MFSFVFHNWRIALVRYNALLKSELYQRANKDSKPSEIRIFKMKFNPSFPEKFMKRIPHEYVLAKMNHNCPVLALQNSPIEKSSPRLIVDSL